MINRRHCPSRAHAWPAFLVVAALATASAAPAAAATNDAGFDQDHPLWTELLGKHVEDGRVSYGVLHSRDRRALTAYLGELEAVTPADYGRFSEAQKIAFWLNAYNAYTVELILRHYPLESIREIGFLPLAAFRDSFIPIRATGEETMSLNDIEHEVLRALFSEPRIHFALVCASESCPPLRAEAFRARDLNSQLDDQARLFINDPTKNRFDAASGTLYLSKIFDWFAEDFVKHGGGGVPFVARYLAGGLGANRSPKIEHLEYDWSLNGK